MYSDCLACTAAGRMVFISDFKGFEHMISCIVSDLVFFIMSGFEGFLNTPLGVLKVFFFKLAFPSL